MRVFLTLLSALAAMQVSAPQAAGPKVFPTAEAAAQALVDASAQRDTQALATVLGPDADALINSGDAVQDAHRRERLVGRAKERLHIDPNPQEPGSYIISIGKDEWPVPLPVLKVPGGYRFDPAKARAEILARRVGHNELRAIEALRELAEAEKQYAYLDMNHDGLHDYAGQILSDPGQKNGLFWEVSEGEHESPLVALVRRAASEGYGPPATGQPPTYHGYAFRLLKGQGPNARGGPRDYVVRGRWIGGFALVASPLEYGVSGVKTFLVSQRGVVREKDLGVNTQPQGAAMELYNPDKTWTKSPRESPEP